MHTCENIFILCFFKKSKKCTTGSYRSILMKMRYRIETIDTYHYIAHGMGILQQVLVLKLGAQKKSFMKLHYFFKKMYTGSYPYYFLTISWHLRVFQTAQNYYLYNQNRIIEENQRQEYFGGFLNQILKLIKVDFFFQIFCPKRSQIFSTHKVLNIFSV